MPIFFKKSLNFYVKTIFKLRKNCIKEKKAINILHNLSRHPTTALPRYLNKNFCRFSYKNSANFCCHPVKSPALAFRKGPRPVQNQKAPVTIWLQDIFGNRLPCFFSRGKPHCSTSFCFSPMLICTKSICLLQFLNLAGHLKPPSPGTDTVYILHLFFRFRLSILII